MVAKVLWAGASSVTQIMTTDLNSLANNTISAASTVVAGQTNLNTYMWLELNVTYGVSPSDANPSVDVYLAQAIDGTNYDTAPLTGGANQGHLYLGSFPIAKVTAAQRITIGPFAAPPHTSKFYLDNQTGQTMAATANTLDIGVNDLESQ